MNKIKSNFAQILSLSLFLAISAPLAFGQVADSSNLNGTFRLDSGRSDDVGYVVSTAARSNSLSPEQKQSLEEQLMAPDKITISTSANDPNTVTIATSTSSETTLRVNGGNQQVTQNDGKRASVSATMRDGVLRLSRVGAGTSFSITFASEENGAALRVTRMITTTYLDRTVYADSYYTRENHSGADPSNKDEDVPYTNDDDEPDSDDDDAGYSSSEPNDSAGSQNGQTSSTGRKYPTTKTVNGRYVVPSGVVISGTLDNKITTKTSQENDRFTMTIDSPSEFQGAVIEGYVTGIQRTGRVTGRSKLTFNFETITLRSGEVYDFVGVLQSVTDSTGKIIKVGDEGNAKGDSKTKESIKRGGIGAGLGAIIGGIIGGGKGAIIGATIGGGAGAGSVLIEGKDDIELLEGSTITVESTSPNTVR